MRNFVMLLLMTAILLYACGTTTKISGSWRKPNATANGYNNLFITAIPVKQHVEDGLQPHLQENGLTISKSIEVFQLNFSAQTRQKKEYVASKIHTTGADCILTISLLKQQTQSRIVHAAEYWNPGLRYGYYNSFWNCYSYWYPSLYSPGIMTSEKFITWKQICMMSALKNLFGRHNQKPTSLQISKAF
ncbi:hypothetical protein EOD41_00635 [Mucilaginibacter limnophilus]|uniref:Lipoprotein n=1 Tax=Mucilaginibacter limnophilus TaxID=1932778 RepID=A0A3S2Y388_9SPHI|nr:hypothetical protein [Mucilaginibacter limnophilus]RVU02480.1 hypothetical protein EOD41_00635 [Mucilaginibacter limnophilus]